MKNNRAFSHLGLKASLSLALVVMTQVAAIIGGYALKGNGTALVACLLPLHVVEILALAHLILNVVLLAKKDKKLAFLQYLVAVLILLLAIACYLESYLIS